MTVTSLQMTYDEALDAAIAAEMRRDDGVFMLSTAAPAALLAEFGEQRVRATPISEAAMTGMAVGASATGQRPIVFWRTSTFSFGAYDQIVNQAAKAHYMFGGQMTFPIVMRATCVAGRRYAAQHTQSPWAMLAHVPGLKIVVPATPGDAYALMRAAIRDENPVVSFESWRLGSVRGEVDEGDVAELGVAATRRHGDDVTVVAIGWMVSVALEAAEELAADGIFVEVIDPRSVAPLDAAAIHSSVRRTGRLVVADEAPTTCSMGAEITSRVAEDPTTFRSLRAPVARVGAYAVPVPYSPPLEDFVLPDRARLVAAIRTTLD